MLVAPGYRDEPNRQLPTEASPRSNRLHGPVAGRGTDDWSLRDIAGYLRLPTSGPFVVIAAQVSAAGDEPLPDIESKLRSLNISSAWRLLPDLQVGVARVTSDEKLDALVALMSRMTTARVGVSAPFEDLRETPTALHVARVMLRGRGDSGSSVAVFDGSILAAAVVSAPEAMIRTVGPALDGFRIFPTRTAKCYLKRFGCGRTTMRLYAMQLKHSFVTPTPSDTGCAKSRYVAADPFRGQRMSSNCT